MKGFWTKNKRKTIVILLVLLFIIPFIIYYIFKLPAPCNFLNAEGIWTAGDILGFYGVILGTTIAALGVYFTIQKTQENALDDAKNKVLPFIALSQIEQHCKYPTVKECESLGIDIPIKNEYSKGVLHEIFFILDNSKPQIQLSLTKQQRYYIETGGIVWENNQRIDKELVSISLEIENVGTGLANDLRIGFNNKYDNGQLVDEALYRYVYPIPLKVGQKINILIYAENKDGSNKGDYSLDFVYFDIYGNGYRQRYEVNISKENPDSYTIYSIFLGNDQEKYTLGDKS